MYCVQCGKLTGNSDLLCEDCKKAAKQSGAECAPHAENALEQVSQASGGELRGAKEQQHTANVRTEEWEEIVSSKEVREKIPVNRCAVAGIILSFAALLALVSMFFVVWFVMAQNPEWFEDDYILTSGDLLRFTMSFVVPLALAFLFSAAGCAVSVVGFLRRKRFRLSGLAIGGFIVGFVIFMPLITFVFNIF